MRLAGILLVLLGTSAALYGCLRGGNGDRPAGIYTWCQVDDPARVNREKANRTLSEGAIGEIACPNPLPPSQRPAELVLPMPCGRKMVFRAVRVAVGDALDGGKALFGNP